MLIGLLSVCGLLVLPVAAGTAGADAGDCPPYCDRIPDSAWIRPSAIPLHDQYRWPEPASLATATAAPMRFEESCAVPVAGDDPRDHAVAARAVVTQPPGDWQLQVQVWHWRGETWRTGETAFGVLRTAVEAVRNCQHTAPGSSATITSDLGTGMAAVISLPGPQVLRQYLLADPRNGTVAELALWASSPPRVSWSAPPDLQVLAALARPLCTAYIDSCL
ncbi:ATPase [Mycolicibacterium thermoresistibile]|nr:ATPase [Mycolicibacterium thermoresistibile]SNW20104.1 metallo-beta-lactamase superfamily protein,putative [Mycolicibacterium thermoresistibile]